MNRIVTLTAGRDPHAHGRYEYHVMRGDPVTDTWETLAHAHGFKSKSAAVTAGRKAFAQLEN